MAKRTTPVALVVVLLLLAGLALPAAAPAKFKPITGKLSKPGYTVIALAANGQCTSAVAKHGKFKLRPPAKKVTLQLRAPDGVYAGPIALGTKKKGKRAIVGARAGAKLGKVVVKPGKGYAKLKGTLAEKWLDPKRYATAKKGVPIGAGNFGRVRVKKLKGPSSDPDLDGVPNPLDIDDDGDLILDDGDPSTAGAARASQAQQQGPLGAFTSLSLWGTANGIEPGTQPVNVNALGLSESAIEAALRSDGILNVVAGGRTHVSGELDCGGLTYCSAGGPGSETPSSSTPTHSRSRPAVTRTGTGSARSMWTSDTSRVRSGCCSSPTLAQTRSPRAMCCSPRSPVPRRADPKGLRRPSSPAPWRASSRQPPPSSPTRTSWMTTDMGSRTKSPIRSLRAPCSLSPMALTPTPKYR